MNTLFSPKKTQILVEGLHLQSQVGVPIAERATPQHIRVDLRLTLVDPAISSDAMVSSVSYKTIVDGVRALMLERSWLLLEKMAEDIADVCFMEERVAEVELRICKLHRLPECEAVGVERVFTRS